MPNFTGMLRAPHLTWEVMTTRKRSLNAAQNNRKVRVEVLAHDEAEAKREVMRQYPEFWVVSVRRKP